MSTNTLKFTTHEGVTKIVPARTGRRPCSREPRPVPSAHRGSREPALDTVRLVRPLSEEDKERTKESLKEKRGIDKPRPAPLHRVNFTH